MSGVDLAQWIGAQLDVDAAEIADPYDEKAWHARGCESVPDVLYPGRETGACDCGVPARVLREIEAKRQVLDRYAKAVRVLSTYAEPDESHIAAKEVVILSWVLRCLASAYTHRPGYAEAVASAG